MGEGIVKKFDKINRKTPIIAGVLILISVFASYIYELIYNLIINMNADNGLYGEYISYSYHISFVPLWFFVAMLLIAVCFIGTYFNKIVSYGVVGALGIVLLGNLNIILVMISQGLQNFIFEYFIGVLWSNISTILIIVACVLMGGYVILAFNKHTFKGLKFWYVPGVVWLVAMVVGLIISISLFPDETIMNQFARSGVEHNVAVIVSVVLTLIDLIADILIPVAIMLYTKYLYSLIGMEKAEK